MKGSDSRYLSNSNHLKVFFSLFIFVHLIHRSQIAQGVAGTVKDKGSVLRMVPYLMHAVRQGFQVFLSEIFY